MAETDVHRDDMMDLIQIPIEPVAGRLPSQILGLHLERDGKELRLYNPATGSRLLKRDEQRDEAKRRAMAAETAQQRLGDENEQLRKEIEALKRGMDPQ